MSAEKAYASGAGGEEERRERPATMGKAKALWKKFARAALRMRAWSAGALATVSRPEMSNESKLRLLYSVRNHSVVLLKGPTGCGKSSQVPQYLLGEAYQREEPCSILVAQPTKIAAQALAQRVARERQCAVGTLVGYMLDDRRQVGPATRLVYATASVVLRTLAAGLPGCRYTHVILDEVHERQADLDLAMLTVRRLLEAGSRTKVVLMSATMDVQLWATYFRGLPHAPDIIVDGANRFSVSVRYLEDVCRLVGWRLPPPEQAAQLRKPTIGSPMFTLAAELLRVVDQAADLDAEAASDRKGAVLIFLPGLAEIDAMAHELERASWDAPQHEKRFETLKLDVTLPREYQDRVFARSPRAVRKVILATSALQSSITIPDVQFVIDFCMTRVSRFNPQTGATVSLLHWVARSTCVQRAGRAGRVMNGRVFRLVERQFFDDSLQESERPEMFYCPLERVVLRAKLLGASRVQRILALAPTPPAELRVAKAVQDLQELGGLMRTRGGIVWPDDGDLTQLGRVMAWLPVDIRLAKLVALGHVLSVRDATIVVAAGMQVGSLFSTSCPLGPYLAGLRWAQGSCSDGVAILLAYRSWLGKVAESDESGAQRWCCRSQLNCRGIMQVADLVRQIEGVLRETNLLAPEPAGKGWPAEEEIAVLEVAMAGAFFPLHFTTTPPADPEAFERLTYETLGDRDPLTTLVLRGFFTQDRMGLASRHAVHRAVADWWRPAATDVRVEFDAEKRLVYVRYVDRLHGCSGVRVHVALQCVAREFEQRPLLRLPEPAPLDAGEAMPRVPSPLTTMLPAASVRQLQVVVALLEHPTRLFLRADKPSWFHQHIDQELNEGAPLPPFPKGHVHRPLDLVAAPLPSNRARYARFSLLALVQVERHSRGMLWVGRFVDHGFKGRWPAAALRRLAAPLATIRGRTFLARLAGVRPPATNVPQGDWSRPARDHLRQLLTGRGLLAEVYSVVDQTAAVVLRFHDAPPNYPPINQQLIEGGYAEWQPEPFRSRQDRERRDALEPVAEPEQWLHADEGARADDDDDNALDRAVGLAGMPQQDVCLRGPVSPLRMYFRTVSYANPGRLVTVTAGSVNAAQLDVTPHDPHAKLLVALRVETPAQGLPTAVQTTLMPNVPGMPALMALLFAPTCALQFDETGTRVKGLLAGLGPNPVWGRAMLPERELAPPVDVDITAQDLEDINSIRHAMDWLLRHGRTDGTGVLMRLVREHYMSLLKRERRLLTTPSHFQGGQLNLDLGTLFAQLTPLPQPAANEPEQPSNCETNYPLRGVQCGRCRVPLPDVRSVREHESASGHLAFY